MLILSSFGLKKRTENFPKQELKVFKLPEKDNLWVFVMAGQSNMAGRAYVESKDTVPNDRILTINKKGEIIVAKEPLHFYEETMTGLDCGLSFGKTLIKHIPDSISILLLPTAVGGSTISEWLGDSCHRDVKLLSNFKEKVKIGVTYGTIKGILWHQGESDSNKENSKLYKFRLTKLINTFRQITKDDQLLVLIGKLGSYSGNRYWKKINRKIKSFSSNDLNAKVIRTSDFTDRGDKLHFDSESQRMIGERFAIKFLESQN